jgi:NADH:ubiquinone oxidoreductase subunit F (NADH-binding)
MRAVGSRARRTVFSVSELARELADVGPGDPVVSPDGLPVVPVAVSHGLATVGLVGDPGTVLLSGPGAADGTAALGAHVARWGALSADRDAILAVLAESGIDGRGGAGFPLGDKVRTALAAPGVPLVIVNAGESEPASAKDATLCALRPHLVLDGAALVVAALGGDEAVVHLHRGAGRSAEAIRAAMAERQAAGRSGTVDDPRWSVSEGPDRYVSGESSAVAAFVAGGDARPRFTARPLAAGGPSGRPIVVANAETLAHLAVAVRLGGPAWRALGSADGPGTRLATLCGGVDAPGTVVEARGGATIGDLLTAGGLTAPPAAVLVGGFAGTWLGGGVAWSTPFTRAGLGALGAGPGCGLVAALPEGGCGLAETARIVGYLAGESAGQCGPCALGLPALAEALDGLAAGRLRRRGLARAESLAEEIFGSGACAHPDAVVRLVRSALTVFAVDIETHLAGRPCAGAGAPAVLDVPGRRAGGGSAEAWR